MMKNSSFYQHYIPSYGETTKIYLQYILLGFLTVFLHALKYYREERKMTYSKVPSRWNFWFIKLPDETFGALLLPEKVFPEKKL